MESRQTAILVFSRSAKAESRNKRLSDTLGKSEELSAQLIKHIKATVNATDLPFYIISDDLQRGQNFGEKMANAFQDIFAKGFKNVIAIGNDCLSLSALDIIYAADVLRKNKAVVGPSQDGGAYLIGMTDVSFDYNNFQNVAWQSINTFECLLEYFDTLCITPITLDYKVDIDTISDWKAGLQGVNVQLKNRILQILNNKDLLLVQTDYNYNIGFTELPTSLRAPPIFQ